MQEATQLVFDFRQEVKEILWQWRRWDVRADGKVFWQYYKSKERWITWESAIKKMEEDRKKASVKRAKDPEKHKALNRAWREQNREKHCQNARDYYSANRKKANEVKRKRRAERRKIDPLFALKTSIRTTVNKAFKNKGYSKTSEARLILGCDWPHLKRHIEAQFTNGMSWDNRSEWHIDHIVPLASAQCKEDIERLNHYSNLRPLWAIENLKKGARILEPS